MPIMTITDDEAEAIWVARQMKEDPVCAHRASPDHCENPTYIWLLAARAELYMLALQHNSANQLTRYDQMHQMLSPWLVRNLALAWHEYRQQQLERDVSDSESSWSEMEEIESEDSAAKTHDLTRKTEELANADR